MVERNSKGVPQAASDLKLTDQALIGPKPMRRRDRLLPALIERQRRSGISHSARNILGKHHHAVADIGPGIAQDRLVIAAKWRSDTDTRNIGRIRATQ